MTNIGIGPRIKIYDKKVIRSVRKKIQDNKNECYPGTYVDLVRNGNGCRVRFGKEKTRT